MREIYYNSDITENSISEIKLLTLYYDKINIVNDAVYSPKFNNNKDNFEFIGVDKIEFIPKSFTTDYKLLIDENIISITKRNEEEKDEYDSRFAGKINALVDANYDTIFPIHPEEKDIRVITQEVFEVMTTLYDFKPGDPVEREFVWFYYALKLKWFIKLLLQGQTCLTSSNNLDLLFCKFIQEADKSKEKLGIKGYSKSFALDALKLNLPNPEILSFEDILELKLKLKDELQLFQQTINSVEFRNKQMFDSYIDEKEYKNVYFNEIQKPLKELELKMQNLKSSTFRMFVERMQNPLSYSPLIGTVIGSVPLNYSLLSSLALTAGASYLDFKENKREIENNGFYFLLKLKN